MFTLDTSPELRRSPTWEGTVFAIVNPADSLRFPPTQGVPDRIRRQELIRNSREVFAYPPDSMRRKAAEMLVWLNLAGGAGFKKQAEHAQEEIKLACQIGQSVVSLAHKATTRYRRPWGSLYEIQLGEAGKVHLAPDDGRTNVYTRAGQYMFDAAPFPGIGSNESEGIPFVRPTACEVTAQGKQYMLGSIPPTPALFHAEDLTTVFSAARDHILAGKPLSPL